jgi:hypothetical protein
MKRTPTLFILLFLIFSIELSASEAVKRIDSIVNDITLLRKNYEVKIRDEKEKNIILEEEKREYIEKISNLENEIKRVKSLLKNIVKNQIIVKEKIKKIVLQRACADENPFPKLKLKNSLSIQESLNKEKVQHFKASSFRLKKSADIYAGMRTMQIVAKWDKGVSFTSNKKSETRIKITGYFVNRVWTKAHKEMWVERSAVIQRNN